MRICFISHYSELYGANRSLLDLISGLLDQDHLTPDSLSVIIPQQGPLCDMLDKLGIQHFVVPFDMDWFDPKDVRSRLAKRRRMRARKLQKREVLDQIKKIDPDIIHSNSSVFLAGAYSAQMLRIPHVWHIREDIKNHYERIHDSKKEYEESLDQAKSIICTSSYIRTILPEQIRDKCSVLYNVVKSSSSKRERAKSKTLRLGVVGLFHKKKNQDFIFDSLCSLVEKENLELRFYGKGDAGIMKSIQDEIDRRPALRSSVFIITDKTNLDDIYSNMDVLINMSEFEAFGRVNIEANSFGIPVIAIKSGASPEIVEDAETGYIIGLDQEQLKNSVLRLHTDRELLKEMGDRAFASSSRFTDLKGYSAQIMETYRSVLK